MDPRIQSALIIVGWQIAGIRNKIQMLELNHAMKSLTIDVSNQNDVSTQIYQSSRATQECILKALLADQEYLLQLADQ